MHPVNLLKCDSKNLFANCVQLKEKKIFYIYSILFIYYIVSFWHFGMVSTFYFYLSNLRREAPFQQVEQQAEGTSSLFS